MKVVQSFKNLVYKKRFWIIVGVVVICALVVWAYKAGWRIRITHEPELGIDWNAISGVSAVISALAAVAIPIVAVAFQHRLDSNKNDIRGSNLELLEKMGRIEKELEQYRSIQNIKSEPSQFKNTNDTELEEKILEYIGVAMDTTLQEVAAHTGISIRKAKLLLDQLCEEGKIAKIYSRRHLKYKKIH